MQPPSVDLDTVLEPQAVRDQLARILISPDFNVPQRLAGFLTFVVEETLAGRADRLKAIAIATEVFGRSVDFDAMNDPVVRIEAGRLRRALERYYLMSGSDDLVVIDIPKGTYSPTFSRRGRRDLQPRPVEPVIVVEDVAPESPKARWKPAALMLGALATAVLLGFLIRGLAREAEPERKALPRPETTLAVSPFANLAGSAGALISAGIHEEVLSALARFRELRVISSDSKTLQSSTATGPSQNVQYRLEGSVRGGQQLRVTVRLLDVESARIVWSQIYDRDLTQASDFEIEADIAAKVAGAVAQPYGAIFTPASRDVRVHSPASADAYLCVLRFYQYRKVLNSDEHAQTRACLEQTTQQYPDYSIGWAMLAYLYLDEDRFGLNRRVNATAGTVRALEAAERAIRLDPANARALQAQMTVLFFSREVEAALRAGEKALALNPNDTEVLAELGARIAQAGDWQRGRAMMQDALARNPAQTGYFVGLVALAYYMQGDDTRALEWIRRADLKKFSIYHFVAALIFARSGLDQEAKSSVATFLTMRPRFFESFAAELATRNFNARDRAILSDGARKVGFPVGLPSH